MTPVPCPLSPFIRRLERLEDQNAVLRRFAALALAGGEAPVCLQSGGCGTGACVVCEVRELLEEEPCR